MFAGGVFFVPCLPIERQDEYKFRRKNQRRGLILKMSSGEGCRQKKYGDGDVIIDIGTNIKGLISQFQ